MMLALASLALYASAVVSMAGTSHALNSLALAYHGSASDGRMIRSLAIALATSILSFGSMWLGIHWVPEGATGGLPVWALITLPLVVGAISGVILRFLTLALMLVTFLIFTLRVMSPRRVSEPSQ